MKKDAIQEALGEIGRHPVLRRLRYLIPEQQRQNLYLVGGAVRDALLGRGIVDFDFVFRGDVQSLCEQLARSWPARSVLLNEDWGMLRVVPIHSQEPEQTLNLDFAPMRGQDIHEDLGQRDFTLNAMAVSLAGKPEDELRALEDPLGGLADLARESVRMVRPERLCEDPVRLLRAFRIACPLGFSIDQETLETIGSERGRLSGAAPERLREELFKLLACSGSHLHVVKMDQTGLLATLLPEIQALKGLEQGPHHGQDGWQHSLETFRVLEVMAGESFSGLEPWNQGLVEWIREEKDRLSVLKLAALLHDVGKPATAGLGTDGQVHFYGHEREGAVIAGNIARRLRLSGRAEDGLTTWVRHHMWPLHLFGTASGRRPTDRAKVRFFRRLGTDSLGCLILAAADSEAKRGSPEEAGLSGPFPAFVRSLLDLYYTRDAAALREPPLVNGHDLMRAFGLQEGPGIGRLLESIHEARVEGKLKTREEALGFVRGLLAGEEGEPDKRNGRESG